MLNVMLKNINIKIKIINFKMFYYSISNITNYHYQKLGYTDDLQTCLSSLQTGNLEPLFFNWVIDIGDSVVYEDIKNRLTKFNINVGGGSEWYIISKECNSLIKDYFSRITNVIYLENITCNKRVYKKLTSFVFDETSKNNFEILFKQSFAGRSDFESFLKNRLRLK